MRSIQTIIGNAGANILRGGGGTDALIGLGGNDIYYRRQCGTEATSRRRRRHRHRLRGVSYALGAGRGRESVDHQPMARRRRSTSPATSSLRPSSAMPAPTSSTAAAASDTMIGLGGNDTYFVDNAADQVRRSGRRRQRRGLRPGQLRARRRRRGREAVDRSAMAATDGDRPDRQRVRQQPSSAMPAPTC